MPEVADEHRARAAEGFNKTYGIVHPTEQWESNRDVRLSPFYEREKALGAVFYEAAAWERPHWYASNEKLLEEFGDRINRREAEWESRWWSPIINAEHLAMRERAAMFDLTAFCIFDVIGPGALECVQTVSMRQMDVAHGKVVYTPVLSPSGTFKSDLTVMRLGDEHFRVVTGGAHGMADLKWYADHAPDGTTVIDLTSAWTTLGLWGPRSRDILASLTRDDMSHAGFPFGTCRTIELDSLRVLASRISYVGELGWELYVPIEQGAKLWDLVWEAGQAHGIAPAGIGVYGTTGRLEKCYRAFGFELDADFTVVEAGMTPPKMKGADFVGKEAHLRHRESDPRRRALHADRRRPHVEVGPEALHARPRADPREGRLAPRRRARPRLVRDERGRRPVDRQAHPDGVPAAGEREHRRGAARRVPRRAVSGDGAVRTTRPRSSTRRTRRSAREDPLLRQAGADHRRAHGADRGRAGDRDEAPRLHDLAARGVRGGGGGADRRGGRRRGRRARRSGPKRRRSRSATAWRSAPTAASTSYSEEWDAQATARGDRRGDPRRRSRST